MNRWIRLGGVMVLGGVLAGCGGDDDDELISLSPAPSPDTTAEVRVVHASADAPDVNAGLDGGGQVSGLVFADATDYLQVPAGSYDVNVDGILPGGSTQTVIDASGMSAVTLDADKETSIYAIGKVGDASIAPLVVTAPDADPAAGQLRAQVVHAASGAPRVDIYVTPPATDITDPSVLPLTTLSFGEFAAPVTVPADNYRIRITPENTPGSPVFDSGPLGLSGDLQVAAIDNVGPTPGNPVRLLVMPKGDDAFVLLDQNAQAAIRAAHLSADTGNVDVVVNGNYGSPLIPNLAFPDVSAFETVAQASYDVDVAASGSGVSAVGVDGLSLTGGERYTAYAVGMSMGSPALELFTSTDDLRSVATEAKLRVVHAASQVPTTDGVVDVYLEPDGADCTGLGSSSPVLSSFAYKEVTQFLSVAAGNYEVCVTPAGMASTVAIGPAGLGLAAEDVITVIARDDGMGGFTASVVDDSP